MQPPVLRLALDRRLEDLDRVRGDHRRPSRRPTASASTIRSPSIVEVVSKSDRPATASATPSAACPRNRRRRSSMARASSRRPGRLDELELAVDGIVIGWLGADDVGVAAESRGPSAAVRRAQRATCSASADDAARRASATPASSASPRGRDRSSPAVGAASESTRTESDRDRPARLRPSTSAFDGVGRSTSPASASSIGDRASSASGSTRVDQFVERLDRRRSIGSATAGMSPLSDVTRARHRRRGRRRHDVERMHRRRPATSLESIAAPTTASRARSPRDCRPAEHRRRRRRLANSDDVGVDFEAASAFVAERIVESGCRSRVRRARSIALRRERPTASADSR